MRYLLILFLFLINNCSLNKDSTYWTENIKKIKIDQKKMSEILKKSDDITTMSIEEYDIYIDDYIKKSKYPNIN
tara:strand:- start:585 stop:806 length:222 start_codon:yes stop_codon:yes gene_type:complete